MPANALTRIVLLDSGAGALSIASALLNTGAQLDMHCILDQAGFPYGKLDDQALLERISILVTHADHHWQPDLYIVACNTASTLVLEALRSRFKGPFIGVVPAVKPAAQQSQSRCIGVMATPATVRRPYLQSLIDQFATHCQTVRIAAPELVELAEQKLSRRDIDPSPIDRTLHPVLAAHPSLDQLVLACTHFPLLAEEIQASLHRSGHHHVRLVDSSSAIVKRVFQLLPELEASCALPQASRVSLASTALAEHVRHYAAYLKQECGEIEVEIDRSLIDVLPMLREKNE